MVFCNLKKPDDIQERIHRHNPYFSRWFSAINKALVDSEFTLFVTILILVDGFLQ